MTPKRNVRYGGQFTILFHSQLIQPNYPNTPHRRSTTFFIKTIFSLSQASFSVLYILLSLKAVNKELLYAFRKFHWIQDVGLYPLEDITVCSTFPFAIKRTSNIVKTPSKSKTSREIFLTSALLKKRLLKTTRAILVLWIIWRIWEVNITCISWLTWCTCLRSYQILLFTRDKNTVTIVC